MFYKIGSDIVIVKDGKLVNFHTEQLISNESLKLKPRSYRFLKITESISELTQIDNEIDMLGSEFEIDIDTLHVIFQSLIFTSHENLGYIASKSNSENISSLILKELENGESFDFYYILFKDNIPIKNRIYIKLIKSNNNTVFITSVYFSSDDNILIPRKESDNFTPLERNPLERNPLIYDISGIDIPELTAQLYYDTTTHGERPIEVKCEELSKLEDIEIGEIISTEIVIYDWNFNPLVTKEYKFVKSNKGHYIVIQNG